MTFSSDRSAGKTTAAKAGSAALPQPWYVLLAPALPMMALLHGSLEQTAPSVIVAPLLIAMAGSLILWLLLLPMSLDRYRAAAAATLLILGGMSYATVVKVAVTAHVSFLVPVAYLVLLLAAGWMSRMRWPAAPAPQAANAFFFLAICFSCVPILWSEATRQRGTVDLLPSDGIRPTDRPDVFVLVLDGYARDDVLKLDYSFDNDLTAELRRKQFLVPELSMANYAQTALSLASAFNLDYLPSLGFDAVPALDNRRRLADVIRYGRFFNAFAQAGYHIRAYASEYSKIDPHPAHERWAPIARMNEFRFTAFESTVAPMIFRL